MKQLHLVLIEPRIPQNTGNIARTCAATGAILHLVHPMGFEINDKKLKRAGLDYWKFLDIRYHNSIEEFFESTAGTGDYYYFTTKGKTVYSEVIFPEPVYLLFGREDAGLPESILYQHPKRCLRVPMISSARSLNLASTVALCTYEVLRQWNFPLLQPYGKLKHDHCDE